MLGWIALALVLTFLFGLAVRWAYQPLFKGPKEILAMMKEIELEMIDAKTSQHRNALLSLHDAVGHCETVHEMHEVLLRYDIGLPVIGADPCNCGFKGLCTGWCTNMEKNNVHRIRDYRLHRLTSAVH